MGRRSVALACWLCALVIVATFSLSGSGQGNAATCQPRCNDGGQVKPAGTSSSTPCIHDVGCGGGGGLTSSVTALFVVLGGLATAVAAFALTSWRRWRARDPQRVGVLLASSLFRPPRLLLSI